MAIIKYTDLPELRGKHKGADIVFCSGVFDLTHAGHVLFFEDCKKLGDILVVSVGSDALVRQYKGSARPILNEHIRIKMVDSLKPVDYSLIDPPAVNNDISVFLDKFFSALKPNTYVVNEDAYDLPSRQKIAQEHGVSLVVLPRICPPEFEKVSTTGIVEKILSTKNSVEK